MCIRDSSTGERQRVQLARAVRNQTTGVLYVLDEPSIGLHPSNVDGLLAVIQDLIAHGNSVVLVDHDIRVLKAADWLIEMGAGAGEYGGNVISTGTIDETMQNPQSLIGKFLSGEERVAAVSYTHLASGSKPGFQTLSRPMVFTICIPACSSRLEHWRNIGGISAALFTVSYTHLDVYKRQV